MEFYSIGIMLYDSYTSCHWKEPVMATLPVTLVADGAKIVIFLFSISIAVLEHRQFSNKSGYG